MLRATTNGLAMNVVEFDSSNPLTHDYADDTDVRGAVREWAVSSTHP
jgi:hypothetical protein